MSSKKYHNDPQYHKLRDISRQATSATGSVRKYFRNQKAVKHRGLRKLVQMKLREASKNYVANDSIYDDCEFELTLDFIDLKSWKAYVDLKHHRWTYDALNPCLRWAESILAEAGEIKLRKLFNTIDNVSTSHLKSHVFDSSQQIQKWSSRTRQALAREFSSRGLCPTFNPRKQLVEIAQQALFNQTETVLTAWTQNLAQFVYFKEGHIWLPIDRSRRSHGREQYDLYRRETKKGLAVSSSWRHCEDEYSYLIKVRHKNAPVGTISHWPVHSWHFYLDWNTRFKINEFTTPLKQLGRAINKYEWRITDSLGKHTFEIALTKNIENDSLFPWTISGTKGLTFDPSPIIWGPIWRPLNGCEDAEAWATDIHQFLQAFYDRELFESAHWRWMVCELLAAVMPNTIR